MYNSVTDFDVAVGEWQVLETTSKFLSFAVDTTKEGYEPKQLKKNGQVKKGEIPRPRTICYCRNKSDAEFIVMEHNMAIKGYLSWTKLLGVTKKAIEEYLEEHKPYI
jgi:hypothetical protein